MFRGVDLVMTSIHLLFEALIATDVLPSVAFPLALARFVCFFVARPDYSPRRHGGHGDILKTDPVFMMRRHAFLMRK